MMFPASVVGSLPRPPEVLKLLDAPYSPAMDEAIRGAIAMQERAGLDVITDGEWRRRSYIGVIAELAQGFTLETNPLDGRPWTVVTERLSLKPAGFIAREAEFLKKNSSVNTKVTLPAPALLGERLWHPVRSRSAYPKRDDFVRDCVAPLRREIELIAAMGVDMVQIDDPHLCLFVDPDSDTRSQATCKVGAKSASDARCVRATEPTRTSSRAGPMKKGTRASGSCATAASRALQAVMGAGPGPARLLGPERHACGQCAAARVIRSAQPPFLPTPRRPDPGPPLLRLAFGASWPAFRPCAAVPGRSRVS
jgi:hypothetical protein